MKYSVALPPRRVFRRITGAVGVAAAVLIPLLLSAPALAQAPSTCVISGTVLDLGAQPVPNTEVRFRVVKPVLVSGSGIASQDLTTKTASDGTWSLTLVQGLNAQVDIPALAIAKDTVIPTGGLCPAAFTSLTLYNRGTLTPATILSSVGPSMGGDLTGNSPNPSVIGLRGKPLINGTPTNNQAWVYNTSAGGYQLTTLAAGSSLNAGSGITITGPSSSPTISVTTGGITQTHLASGAAATNVGNLSSDLTGTLPNPTISANAINNAKVATNAAISWSKIDKTGAVASDVGAAAAGSAVVSITGGTGITVSGGATTPTVGITAGGVTPTQLASGAAATNVGTLSGDLSGTLPSPAVAAGAIDNSKVAGGAAIAWTKINKSGAVASDVGAEASANKGAAGGYAPLDGTSKVPLGNLPAGTTPAAHAASHASGQSDPVSPASIGASATGHTHAEADVTNLVTDLGDKLSKSTGGTVAGNTIFNGTATLNGTTSVTGTFTSGVDFRLLRTADATGGSQQKVSYDEVFEGSVWNGAGAERRLVTLRNTPTGLNAGKLSILGYSTDNVKGSEVAYIDAISGAYTGPTAGTHTGPVTGTVTGNVTGTAATFTGSLTGDVTSTGMATTVASVGAYSAANVAAGATLANAATAANSANQILKRDGAGQVAATTFTGALAGNATTSSDGVSSASGTAPLTLNYAGKAITGSIADAAGGSKGIIQLAGDLGGTAASPTVTQVGSYSAANVAAGATLANAATDANTASAIVRRTAGGAFTATSITATTFTGALTGNATNVTGTVAVGNGGTGTTTLTGLLRGNGASAITGGATVALGSEVSGQLPIANGGTGAASKAPAFDALQPMTTLGDTVYGGAAGTGTRLAGNITTTKKLLTQTGDGANSAAPAWGTLVAADIPSLPASQITSGQLVVANGGTGAATLTGYVKGNGASAFTAQAVPIPVSDGGTGATTLTGYVKGSGASAFSASATIPAATDLSGQVPVANGGTGAATLTGLLRGNGTSAFTGAATVALASEVSGTLPVANGGTGITSLTAGYVPFGNGTSAFGSDLSLFWDNSQKRLGLGTTSPTTVLHTIANFGTAGVDTFAVTAETNGVGADAGFARGALNTTAIGLHTSGTLGGLTGVQATLTGSGNGGTTTSAIGFNSSASVSTGHTFTNRYGFWLTDATGAGSVTNQYGIYISSLTKGGTTNFALYSAGTTPSVHGGKLALGSTTTPDQSLDVTGAIQLRAQASPGACGTATKGVIYYDNGANKWKACQNGGAFVDILGSAGVSGSGVANQVAFWSSASGLTSDTGLVFDGSNDRLGIGGVASPAYTLEVNGDANLALQKSIRFNTTQFVSAGMNGLVSDIVLGSTAAHTLTSGLHNIFLGDNVANAHGNAVIFNTVVGADAAYNLTTANYTTAIGGYALGTGVTISGDGNTAVGHQALYVTTSGTNNTAIGKAAGATLTTGSNNVFVGNTADTSSASVSNAVAIGYQASVGASDSMVLGNSSMKVGIRTATPNGALDVNGAVSTRKGSDLALANGLNSNIALANYSYFRITGPSAVFSLGGFTNPYDGRILRVYNTVAFAMTIKNEDGASTAANRIKTLTGADVTLRAGTSFASFIYDAADSRWILTSSN